MKIDLDEILAAVAPASVEITIDGQSHALRELRVSDVLLFESRELGDREQLNHLAKLFAADVPRSISRAIEIINRRDQLDDAPESLQQRARLDAEYADLLTPIKLIVGAIGVAIAETSPKNVLAAAIPMIRRQIETPAPAKPGLPDSSGLPDLPGSA